MRYRYFLLFSLVSLLVIACTKEPQPIQTVTISDNPYITQVDSFTGNFFVFRPDSFVTSSSGFAVFGYHKDTTFGKINCATYCRFQLPATTPTLNTYSKYDSLELTLYPNRTWYGDTTSNFSFRVMRMNSDMVNYNNTLYNNTFYNTTQFGTFSTPLAAASVKLRPQGGDSIRILLDNTMGQEIFNFFMNHTTEVSSNDFFQQYLKGFKIEVDTLATNVIYGFSNASGKIQLRMYYHEDQSVIVKKSFDFTQEAAPYQFNYIHATRQGSTLAALDTARQVDVSKVKNMAYTQDLTHVHTGMYFPGIKEVLKASDFVRVLAAQLVIRPTNSTYGFYPLPRQLFLYELSPDLTYYVPVYSSSGAQNGSLVIDYVYGKDTRYTYDLSSYVAAELAANDYTTRGLVLSQSLTDSTLSRLISNTTQLNYPPSRLTLSTLVYKKN